MVVFPCLSLALHLRQIHGRRLAAARRSQLLQQGDRWVCLSALADLEWNINQSELQVVTQSGCQQGRLPVAPQPSAQQSESSAWLS